jgi:hypothetical protein
MKRVLAIASIVAVGLATSASASTIVTDGDFNNGLTGWTRTGHGTTPGIGITVITTGGTNSTGFGDNVPSFNGLTDAAFFVDDKARERLSQNVLLTGGKEYTLSFALFATASGAGNPNGFSFISSIGNDVLSALTSATVTVGQWTDYTYTFSVPKSGDFALDFNFISGATPAKDVLLDAVAISAVPEPATWAMLLIGFAGLGFLAYRRNKAPALRHA